MEGVARNWWTWLIRGLIAIAIGVITFLRPAVTMKALVIAFGAYALINGVMALTAATSGAEQREGRGMLILEGVAGIIAGIVAFTWPGFKLLMLLVLIGLWALVSGVSEVVASFWLRKHISGDWLMLLSGVVTVCFGVVLLLAPGTGALALALFVAAYAVLIGVAWCALGFRMRSAQHRTDGPQQHAS
jgi:uncharacterized membrane protein HdeD (DUF308 family)